jgi:hypothetical protein
MNKANLLSCFGSFQGFGLEKKFAIKTSLLNPQLMTIIGKYCLSNVIEKLKI